MTNLPISSPAPAPRETVFSYLARLTGVWQSNAHDLAYDMGAPFKRLLDQDEKAFEALANWAKLSPSAMNELLSWTGVKAGNVRTLFRNELFVSRALRNPTMRGCPMCLREDAGQAIGKASSAMVMRGDWQFREAMMCVRHCHPLVPLWTVEAPKDRFDFGTRLQELEAKIMSGRFDQPRCEPTGYDLWLDRRLESGSDETSFKDQPIFAAATFCRLLGQALLKSDDTKNDIRVQNAHAVGFEVAIRGDAAICVALGKIAAKATGALQEPPKAFGGLYIQLARDYLDEPGFAPFIDILREFILNNWPYAAGVTLLGEVVPERRLHSLSTAAAETGVGAQLLKQFLIEARALQPDDSRPFSRRLFDAKAHSALLNEIPTLVGPIAMRTAMGATRMEFERLIDAGLLTPRTKDAKIKKPWRTSDGISFVAALSADAIPVEDGEKDWETLLLACKRRAVDLATLIQGIRDKRLTAGQRIGSSGFHDILVLVSEVDHLAARNNSAQSELSGTVAATEFGRSVGLRDHVALRAIIEAGYVQARLVMNPRLGRLQLRMSLDDREAFHQQFATLTTLSAETGQHRNTLKAIIKSKGIMPFSPIGQNFGAVYLRNDLTGLEKI